MLRNFGCGTPVHVLSNIGESLQSRITTRAFCLPHMFSSPPAATRPPGTPPGPEQPYMDTLGSRRTRGAEIDVPTAPLVCGDRRRCSPSGAALACVSESTNCGWAQHRLGAHSVAVPTWLQLLRHAVFAHAALHTPLQGLVAINNLWKQTTGSLSIDLKRKLFKGGAAPGDSLWRVQPGSAAQPSGRRPPLMRPPAQPSMYAQPGVPPGAYSAHPGTYNNSYGAPPVARQPPAAFAQLPTMAFMNTGARVKVMRHIQVSTSSA